MGVNGIYGLSGSGLDIESMVKVGMMSKQTEYDRMYKKETRANWQKEAYVDLYNEINTFNNSKLTDYKLQSKMNAMQATSNNTSAVTVSANGSAVPMSHKVEVKSLSSNAYLMSTGAITRNSSADSSSINLKDSMFQSITDNGDDTYTIKDWSGTTKTVNGNDTALSLTLDDGKSSATLEKNRTVTMTYAEIAGDKSFNDLASGINKLGLNITAAYDTVNDTFSLYNKSGGSENTISIKANDDATAQLFNNLNLGKSVNGELEAFAATAPDKAEGTITSYFGTDSVTEMLGLGTYSVTPNADTYYMNGQQVTKVSDPDLPTGVERYNIVPKDNLDPNSKGLDALVRTSTVAGASGDVTRYQYSLVTSDDPSTGVDWDYHAATINGNEYDINSSSTDSDGTTITRYRSADGNTDVLVRQSLDSEFVKDANGDTIYNDDGLPKTQYVTHYKMATVTAGGAEPDWSTVTAETDNPVTLDNSTRKYSTTNPITTVNQIQPDTKYQIDGKPYNLDSTDAATGVSRYTSVNDPSAAAILVKTTSTEENVTDEEGNVVLDTNGNPKTQLAYSFQKTTEPTDGSTVDWSNIASTKTDPVSAEGYVTVTNTKDGVTTNDYKSAEDPLFSFTLDDGSKETKVNITYGDLNNLTIDKVVDIINNADSDVKASFTNGKLTLQNNKAGAGHNMGLTTNDNLATQFFNSLGLTVTTGEKAYKSQGTGYKFNAGDETTVAGANGSIVVDGRTYDNITDNRATVGGVTYTLLDKTESAATVTVTQDQSSIVDQVKKFVEDYNTLLKSLQDKYTETKYSDYDVLTKSQEDAMTKEQVEKWTEKAKSGTLNHDSYLSTIISKMREALSTPVDGVSGRYNSAFSIGIRTNTDQGQIELDEDKLKTVLASEPNAVYEIFGKMGEYDSSTKTSDFSTSGVAQRLGDVFNTQLNKLKSHAGTTLSVDDNSEIGNKIKDWQSKMSDFKTKMSAFETLLYKKYDAMEVALQKLAMTMNYVSFNQQ